MAINIKTTKKDLDQIELLDPYNDSLEDYEVQEKIPFGYLVANLLLQIQRVIATEARSNPTRFRDMVDMLYIYVLSDADNDIVFQEDLKAIIAWKKLQVKDLPPQRKEQKLFLLEFEYTFKKLRLIMKLMDRKGYFGSKVLK